MTMNRFLLIGLMLLFLIADSSSTTQKSVVGDDDYVLVFSDDFNQPNGSQPDPSKWSRSSRGPSTWNRWISDSRKVVYIKGGNLVCRAIPNKDLKADTAKMLTGAIESFGKFSFQYGKVEVRMKTNLLQGNFPAVWLKPSNEITEKPYRYGEIDIVEMFGYKKASHHTIHTHQSHMLKKKDPTSYICDIDVSRWHVYGIEWTKDYVMWRVDGQPVGFHFRSDDPQDVADGQWTFDREFYLRLNQSVGNGNFVRAIPQCNKVYETRFDWIRVYQKTK